MRCTPQVHGAAREALTWIGHIVSTEMNAATDNPMVFADTNDILSGGNFHGEPIAMAADLLVIALAQLATISERRSERLVNPASERLAGVPHAARRSSVGADDRAGHRRRAHVRAEDARPPGERRHDSDLGEQGGSREHEHGGRAESGTSLAACDICRRG